MLYRKKYIEPIKIPVLGIFIAHRMGTFGATNLMSIAIIGARYARHWPPGVVRIRRSPCRGAMDFHLRGNDDVFYMFTNS